jgi:hypothetical protein
LNFNKIHKFKEPWLGYKLRSIGFVFICQGSILGDKLIQTNQGNSVTAGHILVVLSLLLSLISYMVVSLYMLTSLCLGLIKLLVVIFSINYKVVCFYIWCTCI